MFLYRTRTQSLAVDVKVPLPQGNQDHVLGGLVVEGVEEAVFVGFFTAIIQDFLNCTCVIEDGGLANLIDPVIQIVPVFQLNIKDIVLLVLHGCSQKNARMAPVHVFKHSKRR